MSVHYKFKSGKEKHTVIFDGLHISVSDLKKEIMKQRKIGKSTDLDLQISNPQTGEVYESDSMLIPKNTSVDVARVPVSGNQKKYWDRHENNSSKGSNIPSHIEVDKITKSSNLSTSYGTEDEKIKAMMSQSTQEYDPSKYVKNRGIVGPLPSNYTCYRCGQPGHYIKQCPTNNSDVKRSTGIPRSFMISASADQKGALITASGDYAVPIIDFEAYKEVKKEKPPFLPNSESEKEVALPEIPEDLKCTLCQSLLQDAVLIPCCGNSYCDECVRSLLLETENHECPTCHEVNVSPDTLIPNRYLRISVAKFKNETGYENDKYVSNVIKTNQIKQFQTDNNVKKIETKDVIETNSVELKSQLSPQLSQSPIRNSSDVTMDEVILGSPKKEELIQKTAEPKPIAQPLIVSKVETISPKMEETNDLNDDGIDSQQETATGSNTPLVDEPSDSYETNEEHNQIEVNPIVTLPHYQNQPLLAKPMYPRPQRPQQFGPIRTIRTTVGQPPNHTLLGRPPTMLLHPRNYPRPGMTQDARFYRPMTDSRGFPMGLSHVPPYGYAPQMRPPAYHDPYGYMGPRSHMPTGPMHHTLALHQQMGETPPPGTAPIVLDNIYQYTEPEYDDYEDRVNRFTRQLESRPTRRPKARSRTRSRSRSHSRSSRSRSSSGSSSSSSSSSSRSSRFSFSSRSFSGSSRSRSYSPRRRSRSRDRYRRRSRSPSPRHNNYNRDFRYRRSRSPHYNDSSRRYDRSRHEANNDRDRDNKYRDNRSNRYERNDTYFRSRRSADRNKDSKQTHSNTRCNHKSSHEKVRTREKNTGSDDLKHKDRRSKTPLKDETDKVSEIKDNNNKSETIGANDSQHNKSDANELMKSENRREVKDISLELSENVKIEENEDKDKSDKKKDKSKKHHKHHHHHKHRKGSDNGRDEKTNNDSKALSKKKHKHKKHKQSETVNKTTDDVKEKIEDNSEIILNPTLKTTENADNADIDILNSLVVNEYETDFVQQNKTIFDDNVIVNDVNELNIESAINDYELYSGIDSISDNKSPNLVELISTDLPNYSTVEFSTDSQKAADEEVVIKDAIDVNNKIQLVDYTDNEDLAETGNESLINSQTILNNEPNKELENDDKTDDIENKVSIEIPKSKWDEDFNVLKFEEEYSDFEDSQKCEYETHDNKNTHNSQNDKSLPNDIIQKAEKAILEKPLRAAIVEKRDKTSNSDKKSKTSKSDERDKKVNEVNDYERNKRDKDSDKGREKDKSISNDQTKKSSSKSQSESKSSKNNDDSNDNHPRKVKLDRSKFAEKPTLSITIDNSEKEKNASKDSRSSNRNDDKDSKSYNSYDKSSRDKYKDRSRSERKSSKDRKESSKTSKSRDESRHRSHKRSKRSRSRSSSSHKRYKNESQKKSKTKSSTSRKSK